MGYPELFATDVVRSIVSDQGAAFVPLDPSLIDGLLYFGRRAGNATIATFSPPVHLASIQAPASGTARNAFGGQIIPQR